MTRKVHENSAGRFTTYFGMSEGLHQTAEMIRNQPWLTPWERPHDDLGDRRGWTGGSRAGRVGPHAGLHLPGYYQAEGTNREVFTPNGFSGQGIWPVGSEDRHVITGPEEGYHHPGRREYQRLGSRGTDQYHPKVEQAAVVGNARPLLGERACAFVKRGRRSPVSRRSRVVLQGPEGSILLCPERIELIEEPLHKRRQSR